MRRSHSQSYPYEVISTASRIEYGTIRNGERQLRRTWAPSGPPRAVVLMVHGIAEHSGRYEAVGSQLAAAGFAAVCWDQRGHGKPEGRRGHVEKFTEFLDDVEDHMITARAVGVPVVLLGHSMGGLVAASYAVSGRPAPDLLVLSGPALGVPQPKWQQTFLHKFAQLAPRLFLKPPFDTAVLSRDPAVGAAYDTDPLVKPGGTVQLISQLMLTAEATASDVAKITMPTLCLHGGDDELVPTVASAVLEGVAGVERRVLEGLRHEIFNEPEGRDVVAQVIDWIDANLA